MKSIFLLLKTIRINQWIKNFSLFAALVFTGQLFNSNYLFITFLGFLVFCGLSSASYIFNDLIDRKLDRKHPQKKYRPIASGEISVPVAVELLFVFAFFSLVTAFILSISFFLLSLLFFTLHIFYTLYFKKHALLDILTIASSFLIRVFAGEILTGYHIPIWLTFSVIFLSLFIASCKRRSELILEGSKTRPTLLHYRKQLLDFYNSTFATGTIITYAMFTFEAKPVTFNSFVREFLLFTFPEALGRKWLMVITLPLVIVGIMRYAQLIYERDLGEAPEKVVTTDKPLIISLALWAVSVVLFLYIL